MKHYLTPILLAASLTTVNADSLTSEQLLQQRDLAKQTAAHSRPSSTRNIVPTGCLASPLPTQPKQPSYFITHTNYDFTEAMTLTFWRESCTSGAGGGSALLMRATPAPSSVPFLCSISMNIVQNGMQNNEIKLVTKADGSSWCDDLLVPTTFLVSEYDFGQDPFIPTGAMTVYYGSGDEQVKLDIPAGIVTPPIATTAFSGTMEGYKRGTVKCTNLTTKKTISFALPTDGKWDCKAKGLAIGKNQKVSVLVTGVIK